jgi:hypothetical protein
VIDAAFASLEAATAETSPQRRLLALRNAGEALAEAVRAGTSVPIQCHAGERMVLEREVALPALRSLSAFVSVERRTWQIDRTLIDPSSDVRVTPFFERFTQRHPLRHRALDPRPAAPIDPTRIEHIVLTTLRYHSLAWLLEHYPRAMISVHPLEHARYVAPAPVERAAYERDPVIAHERLVLGGAGRLACGAVLVNTPGLGPGSRSVLANHAGTLRLLSPHGVALDAWTPYESKLPGLREQVRLRDIEVCPRGDSDPEASSVSMGLERVLADRRSDAPAFFEITPSLELVASKVSWLSPTVRARSHP